MKAIDLALRLEEIAHVVDVADVDVVKIGADRHGEVVIHLASPEDVDKVVALFDDAKYDDGAHWHIYQRRATFDEVIEVVVFSGRGDR